MDRKANHIILAGVTVWCTGIVLAPVFAGSGFSDLLYAVYGVVCHQFASRSASVAGAPLAVCLRCCAIYAGFGLAMLTAVRWHRRSAARMVLWVLVMPMAVDGFGSLFSVWESTAVSRLATGFLFGIGMALILHAPLTETVRSLLNTSLKGMDHVKT